MCHSDDVNHERCGLPLKNKTYCISRVTEKCKDSKKGTLASYGIWAWLNASHCKLIVWCSPCAQVEWELRDTPEEDRTDKQKRCTSKLPGSCNGKTVPSYGLPENARLWCAPCAQREWEDRGTPETSEWTPSAGARASWMAPAAGRNSRCTVSERTRACGVALAHGLSGSSAARPKTTA